jgi:hypothetical protein
MKRLQPEKWVPVGRDGVEDHSSQGLEIRGGAKRAGHSHRGFKPSAMEPYKRVSA